MYKLHIRVLAKKDIQSAVDYYQNISPTLADRFLNTLYTELEHLQRNPALFQIQTKNIRVNYLREFPFGIYYIWQGDIVEVLAVLHTHRSPKVWQGRG